MRGRRPRRRAGDVNQIQSRGRGLRDAGHADRGAGRRPSSALSLRTWMPPIAFTVAFIVSFLAGTPYAVLDYPRFQRTPLRLHALSGGTTTSFSGEAGSTTARTRSVRAGLATFAAALVGLVPFYGDTVGPRSSSRIRIAVLPRGRQRYKVFFR